MTVDEFERGERIDTAKRRECKEAGGHSYLIKERDLKPNGKDGFVCSHCGQRDVRDPYDGMSWYDTAGIG